MHIDSALSGIEYVHLMRELKRLEGGRINKIYQNKELFLFAVYTGNDRTNLLIEIPKVMYFTDHKPKMPDMPGGFCMFLRKRLQGSRVNDVIQRGSERVIEFHCSTKDHEYVLIFEMFGKGNMVVCDADLKIISSYESIKYKDRAVRGGQTYEYPEPQPDFTSLTSQEFAEFFGDEQPVKVLASQIGLGGEFAELVCLRADIDKTQLDADTDALYAALQSIIAEGNPNYTEDRAYPLLIQEECTKTETFSGALASLLDPHRTEQRQEKQIQKTEKKQNKYERIITAQTKQIKGLTESSQVNQRKGELLYEQFQDLDTLLKEARKDSKEMNQESFVKKYENHPLVTAVSGLEITIDIGE
jgi:predicted ribosome quality control (RQC) complex YloA/Tae2 family protein